MFAILEKKALCDLTNKVIINKIEDIFIKVEV